MQGKITVGKLGAADIGMGRKSREGRGGEDERVGDTGVVVSANGQRSYSALSERRGTDSKMGRGERLAIAVYQFFKPSCVMHVAKKPGARTRPHCAPASLDIWS